MVRKTTKMLKKLNKNSVKFDGKKKKFFTSTRRKPISEMDCYNCRELGHLAHQCTKPKKDKYKKKYKGKKDVDRISSAVLRGVSHKGRLIGREACDQEQEGNRDTRVRQVQAISMT